MRPAWRPVAALALQAAVLLAGLAAVAFLLGEPHLEGRNTRATLFQIYFQDPFLAYVYAGSIPFFLALRRAFALGECLRRGQAVSPGTLAALHAIRRCGWALLGFVAGGLVLVLLHGDREDRPAGLALGVLASAVPVFFIRTSARLARSVQRALARSASPSPP